MAKELYSAKNKATDVVNLSEYLVAAQEFEEAKSLTRKKIPEIRDDLGPDHRLTLEVRTWCARALFDAKGASEDDVSEAEAILEDVLRRSTRVLGEHPDTQRARKFLEEVRSARVDEPDTVDAVAGEES